MFVDNVESMLAGSKTAAYVEKHIEIAKNILMIFFANMIYKCIIASIY